MRVGFIHSVEGIKKKKTQVPRGKRNSSSRLPLSFILKHQFLPESPVCSWLADFRLASPHNYMSKFLKISILDDGDDR